MYICKISIFLAYAMAIYTIASIYYLVMTQNIETPFKDSLTVEQLAIKYQSSNIRKDIFIQGCGLAIVICCIVKPFRKC